MMDKDLFADTSFGKAALKKLGPVPENFRLYSAGWLGAKPEDWDTMKVTGAEFRVAKRGKNAGKLSVMIPGTCRTVYVTKEEMGRFDESPVSTPENHAYRRYGIAVGQVYVRADAPKGQYKGRLFVRDVETFAEEEDVVVFDEDAKTERRIDAFKLAKVRYSLVPGPYAVKSHAFGGSTGINDYLMTDGSIRAMRPDEVCWAPPSPEKA